MKIVQSIPFTSTLTHFIVTFTFFLFLFLPTLQSAAQQYDCSQPGGCSIMVTDYSGSEVYADTYFGPNYSLNRVYTGETYTFDIMPVFTGIDVAIYWPSSDWGDCDEVGVFYSVTPNEGVTTQLWGGSPHMYLDVTFPSWGSWILTAGHDGWSCQQLHCGTTVNGCDDYMSVTLTSPPTPTPIFTPTPISTPTPTPTPWLEIILPTPVNDLFISNVPATPQPLCQARLVNYSGGPITFNWEYKISFDPDAQPMITKTVTGTSTASNSDITTFSPNLVGEFYGGNVNIKVTALTYTKQENNPYMIKGTNPASHAVITSELSEDKYRAICWKESTYRQFDSSNMPLPNSDHDGGYGLMQITTNPSPDHDDMWNWKENISTGKTKLNSNNTQSNNHLYNLNHTDLNPLPNPALTMSDTQHLLDSFSLYRKGRYYYTAQLISGTAYELVRDVTSNETGCDYADLVYQYSINKPWQ